MRLRGGRTGKRAVVCERLELTGLMQAVRPGGLVRRAGRRARGRTGRASRISCGCWPAAVRTRTRSTARWTRWWSHPVRHEGRARLGARVRPGCFAPDPRPPGPGRPDPAGRSCTAATAHRAGMPREAGVPGAGPVRAGPRPPSRRSSTLSGGQQARLQILLLELSGATLLLLDEPTDNLDLHSAEALRGRPGRLRGHGPRGHPRPLVRPLLRPVRHLRGGRLRARSRRAEMGPIPPAPQVSHRPSAESQSRGHGRAQDRRTNHADLRPPPVVGQRISSPPAHCSPARPGAPGGRCLVPGSKVSINPGTRHPATARSTSGGSRGRGAALRTTR